MLGFKKPLFQSPTVSQCGGVEKVVGEMASLSILNTGLSLASCQSSSTA